MGTSWHLLVVLGLGVIALACSPDPTGGDADATCATLPDGTSCQEAIQQLQTTLDGLATKTHEPYQDTQARAAMGGEAASNPLNHARYDDAEALGAMGPAGAGNPLNHERYTDAESVAAVHLAGVSAGSVSYEGSAAGLAAEDVSSAIDEVALRTTGSCGGSQALQALNADGTAQCTGVAHPPVVAVLPPDGPIGTPGTVLLPDGTVLDTTGTITAGIQEAIDEAAAGGWDLVVYGRGLQYDEITWPGPNYPTDGFFNLSTGLVFPPMQGKTIKMWNVTLNFDPNVTGAALEFDSTMIVDFELTGQIVAVSAAHGVSFRPQSPHPLDGPLWGTSGVVDSRFRFGHVLAKDACISFDSSGGGITRNSFFFHELNGGGKGVEIKDPVPGHCFCDNDLEVLGAHQQTKFGVQVGESAANPDAIFNNRMSLFIWPATGDQSVGLQLWGRHNDISVVVTSQEGLPYRGISVEESAAFNFLKILRTAGTTGIVDDATNKTNTVWTPEGRLGLGIADPDHPIEAASGAFLSSGGAWTNASSRTLKEGFRTVDVTEVLRRVRALPITEWRYRADAQAVRHIGPVAEDFEAAFALGGDGKSLSAMDSVGVALAGIQALAQQVDALSDQLRERDEQIKALQGALAARP